MRKPITAVTVLLVLTTLCSCLQPMKKPVLNESAESSATVTSSARNGSSEPISTVKPDEVTDPATQTDYDSETAGETEPRYETDKPAQTSVDDVPTEQLGTDPVIPPESVDTYKTETPEMSSVENENPPARAETDLPESEPSTDTEFEGEIYGNLNYFAGFRQTADGKSLYMVITDGEREITIPYGGNQHILAFAYRIQSGAVIISVLQESSYETTENEERVIIYNMSVVSYFDLQRYNDIESSSARVGIYPGNTSMTDASVRKNKDQMLASVDAGNSTLYRARNGSQFVVLIDYDSSRPGSENTVLAESESYPDSFDWHMGREIGAIDFSPSCSSAD